MGVAAWLPIPNHFILLPGPAVATGDQVDVEDYPRPTDPGDYYITTVYRRSATTWWALRALIQSDWTLVSEHQDRPQSQSSLSEDEDHQILRRVVYQTCGLEPPLIITVLDLTEDSPLRGKVDPGDRLLQVAGEPLRMVAQVRQIVQRIPAGQPIEVTLQKPDGRKYTVEAVAKPIQGLPGSQGLGVLLSGHEENRSLPKIRFQSGAYEGNSSDLVLGLDVCERLLNLNLRRGRRVAGSGGLAMDGSLTSVQGLRQKFFCARSIQADIMFVPWSDQTQLRGKEMAPGKPEVVPVHSLNEAIHWLQKPKH